MKILFCAAVQKHTKGKSERDGKYFVPLLCMMLLLHMLNIPLICVHLVHDILIGPIRRKYWSFIAQPVGPEEGWSCWYIINCGYQDDRLINSLINILQQIITSSEFSHGKLNFFSPSAIFIIVKNLIMKIIPPTIATTNGGEGKKIVHKIMKYII